MLSACYLTPTVMSKDAMIGLEAQPVSVDGETELHITGICGSALVLRQVKMSYDADTIVVRVYASLTRGDVLGTCDVDFRLRVPKHVRRVLFGNDRQVIWSRPP
jgi:hypothetical protein